MKARSSLFSLAMTTSELLPDSPLFSQTFLSACLNIHEHTHRSCTEGCVNLHAFEVERVREACFARQLIARAAHAATYSVGMVRSGCTHIIYIYIDAYIQARAWHFKFHHLTYLKEACFARQLHATH